MFWYDTYTIFRDTLVLIAPKPSGFYILFVCYVGCVIGYKIYTFVDCFFTAIKMLHVIFLYVKKN
jgi:hypothetical protein